MNRSLLVLVVLGAMASTAVANSKLLILHSEGRADAKTRTKVDAAIVKLAKTGPDVVTPGEITFSEAAAMVGCRTEEPACATEVANTLAVDELIIVTVTPKPPDFEIRVRRVGKGTKDASTTVAPDKLDKLDALAPVFGGKAPVVVEPVKPVGPAKPPVGPEPPPAVTTKPTVTEPITKPPVTTDKPAVADLTPMSANPDPTKPTVEPQRTDKQPRDRRRLYMAGMISGGAMVFLGVILWTTASGVQGQIDEAPTRTKGDIDELRRLENKADSLASWGNFFALGGLVLGGISTYFYVKHERAKRGSRTARFAPALFDRGAGVTLTFGGTP